ncbi:hypothetical protein CC78DRAFT_530386 [Lojkania enalia]|uniref:DNA-directed RNA polymerase III subunit n=1 Tax=Lojkania enalia TaxID=147567 RepID=A0A9P4KJ38_9PLEO|nr:hypothetical protein CC78DRAFT_530386 [Didymosphaeria enalia]
MHSQMQPRIHARNAPGNAPLRPEQKMPPPQAPPPNPEEKALLQYHLTVRDRIHEGPFYTVLSDGMQNGMKRKANDPAPTEAMLFNPFTDNQTYSSRYLKVYRKLPRLDTRHYILDLFPPELQSLLGHGIKRENGELDSGRLTKKRKIVQVTKGSFMTRIERYMQEEDARREAEGDEEEEQEEVEEEEAEDDDKPDQIDEDDDWSAVSSDSEDADDDYNAEQYFDNGEDDDIDEGDPYENTYE